MRTRLPPPSGTHEYEFRARVAVRGRDPFPDKLSVSVLPPRNRRHVFFRPRSAVPRVDVFGPDRGNGVPVETFVVVDGASGFGRRGRVPYALGAAEFEPFSDAIN